jgi:hypothetical protein
MLLQYMIDLNLSGMAYVYLSSAIEASGALKSTRSQIELHARKEWVLNKSMMKSAQSSGSCVPSLAALWEVSIGV